MAEVPVCPGCGERVLADGLRVLLRPVVPSDRFELAARYLQLSSESKRSRFFGPPGELSEENLDYLTTLDYDDHFAVAAFALDEPGAPGIGVARYVRDKDDPTIAEVAVTVIDRFQRRGLGTLLTYVLAEIAVDHGVRTFVHYVLWTNDEMIEMLQRAGARVMPDEPGIARIELDLPGAPDPDTESVIHRLLSLLANWVREHLEGAPADEPTAGPR